MHDQLITAFNELSMQIETFTNPQFVAQSEAKYHIKGIVNEVFDAIVKDDDKAL